MSAARKWATGLGFALVVLIAVVVAAAGRSCDRNAAESALSESARERRHFAMELRKRFDDLDLDLRTEGEWDEGLVMSPCNEAKLQSLIAGERSGLADHVFRWVRCKDGARINGEHVWLR